MRSTAKIPGGGTLVLRLNLQFYGFFVTMLCGAALGVAFDLLRVTRRMYQPGRWTAPVVDLVFWVVASATLSSGLFLANWAELRFYVVVGILSGVGLYLWLASPVVSLLMELLLRTTVQLILGLFQIVVMMVWKPLIAVVALLVSALRLLVDWGRTLGTWVWRVVIGFGGWLLHPFRSQLRCARLKYLRFKRKWRWFLRR